MRQSRSGCCLYDSPGNRYIYSSDPRHGNTRRVVYQLAVYRAVLCGACRTAVFVFMCGWSAAIVNTSKHLLAAVSEWQQRNNTTHLPTRLLATADVVHDLQRQNAVPQWLEVVYISGDCPILKVE